MPILCPVIGRAGGPSLFSAISAAGLTANLQTCLDAGDASSYSSGQKWLDLSGNGQDWFLGSTSSAQATDPTFNGTAGNLYGAYFSSDGGDFFTYDTTNATWMQNMHKSNATFTILAIAYYTGSLTYICGTCDGSTGTGTNISMTGSGGLHQITLNAGTPVSSADSSNGLLRTGWNFVACSLDAAVGVGHDTTLMYVNGTLASEATSYSSPSAGSATNTMRIGANGDVSTPAPSGARFAAFAGFSAALTQANLDSLFTRMRGRFGI